MANPDTIKAITANLAAVLTAQGFLIEDSSTDTRLETSPLCSVRHTGERFEAAHGERPLYNELRYSLIVSFSAAHPSTSRDKVAEWMHKIRSNVNINGLNTGALLASKLVSWVNHEGYNEISHSPPVTELEYNLIVRYREA